MIKFNSNVDEKIFLELKSFSEKNNVEITTLLDEALKDLLIKKRLRPICRKAAEDVLRQYDQAFRELK